MQNDWTKAGLKKDQFRSRMLGDSPDTQDLLDYSEKKRSGRREAATNPPPASKPGLPSPDEARRILEERRKARGH